MKRIGREAVEVNINAPQEGHVPIYDAQNRLWNTVSTSSFLSETASYAFTASLAENAISSSYATFATTSSFANDFTVTGTLTAQRIVVQVITSSVELVTGSLTVSGSLNALGGVTGSLLGTSSWAQNAITASHAINALTASFASSGTGKFTGSFSGSLFGDGFGITNIQASSVVGLNLSAITSGSVTASVDPAYGFKVNSNSQISGSTQITGSLGVTGSVSILGNIGNIFSANVDKISFTGSFYQSGSMDINGSLIVSQGITGSLYGTSSWAVTSSYAVNALTSSYAITASNALTASTADDFYVRQELTASEIFVTGSSRLGTLLTNTHEFTGSVTITGSLFLNDDPVVTYAPYNAFSSSIQSRTFVLENASASFAQDSGSNSVRLTNLEYTASILTTASASFAVVSQSYSAFSQSYNTASFTGSFIGEGYLTGSLYGTSSWSENAISSSYALTSSFSEQAISSSFSLTASYVSSSNVDGPFGNNSVLSSSYAVTASHALTASSADDFLVRGTLTAQTIIVQTITSSREFVTGSTRFGSLLSNTHEFTGSVSMTGSFNAINATISGSLYGTSSWAENAITASFATTASYAVSASQAQNAVSSSYPISISGSTIYSPLSSNNIGFNTDNGIFIGDGAGYNATNANYSNFLGRDAGQNATNALVSNFLGFKAGQSATNAEYSNFLGENAGYGATDARRSNFLGANAGNGATDAIFSNFLGNSSGNSAKFAKYSNFLGASAGQYAISASYSTLLGYRAGFASSTALSIKSNNIIIGTNITLDIGRQDSINIGGLIFGTGSYSDINTQSSGSANGRIGINQPLPLFSLDVSGSGNYSNGLTASGSIFLPNITNANQTNVIGFDSTIGRLYYQSTSSLFVTSASYAISSSHAQTASYVLNAVSASFASTASYSERTIQIDVYVKNVSGAQINKGRVVRISGAVGDNPLITTASYINDNNSANTLGIATENIPNDSFGYVITEGILYGINTQNFTEGQIVYLGATGSIIGSPPEAPLHEVRLGEVLRVQQNNGSIYVRIQNGYELGELHDVVDTTTSISYGDLLVRSGSVWHSSKQLTGPYGLTGSLTATNGGFTGSLYGTSSWATQAITASYADYFTVKNNAIVSGSLTILQNLTVFGSASITYVTESTLDISTNLIRVNTNTPSIRFGGLAVIDSGSSPQVSGSWLFDSDRDRWVFIHQDVAGSPLTSSIAIMGPETYGNLGNETQITFNRLTKGYSGVSGEHIGDSQVSDDGTTVSIPGNLTVTGSIRLSSSLHSVLEGVAPEGVSTAMIVIPTGSFNAAFFDYTISSGSNARAGTITAVWNGDQVRSHDNSTVDIGNTSLVTIYVGEGAGNVDLTILPNVGNWKFKAIYRLI